MRRGLAVVLLGVGLTVAPASVCWTADELLLTAREQRFRPRNREFSCERRTCRRRAR